MPVEIVTIPCLEDNYAFLIHDPTSGETALVDAPEAAPISAELNKRGWDLSYVLITHHHWDHVDGLAALLADYPAQVIGSAADAHRLPPLDRAVHPGDTLTLCSLDVHILDVTGHTIDHIAFYMPGAQALFSADSLMALGCGRLFEGTPEQMFQSLNALAKLPGETLVYSGHEYTASNAKFAATIEPNNKTLTYRIEKITAARAAGHPTVPSQLAIELETNPFLRAHVANIAEHLNMAGAAPVDVWTEIRKRKDSF